MFEGFESDTVDTGESRIFFRRAGHGPPLLLLHGFPETHLMWRDVAPRLTEDFTIICADLRGDGGSTCPDSTLDHAPYAKRAMAADMIALMERLGFAHFAAVGHDRGGRVAYRMALDHPDRLQALAVLDGVPTAVAWDRADDRFALGFWPGSLLAQPSPLPEQILAASAAAIVDHALAEWGSNGADFPADVRAAYAEALAEPAHAHAICEEYRAAAALDRQHDQADRDAGRRIRCPLLVLWSGKGPLESWYEGGGGPIGLWGDWADQVEGQAVDSGHFFPEEKPELTAEILRNFLATV